MNASQPTLAFLLSCWIRAVRETASYYLLIGQDLREVRNLTGEHFKDWLALHVPDIAVETVQDALDYAEEVEKDPERSFSA